MNSILLTDSYKLQHKDQYPEGTTLVFSNFTPRSDNHAPEQCKENGVVVFGVQLMMKQLVEHFDKNFFKNHKRHSQLKNHQDIVDKIYDGILKQEVIEDIKSYLNPFTQTDFDTSGFEELWDLGYLPIEVRALDEGTLCPMRVPMLTIHNTLPEFFWVTNYLETIMSTMLWKPMTSATIAHAYKKLIVSWALKTDPENIDFTQWQGHDFSSRGLDSIDAIIASGLGHLVSFSGTDSLPPLWGARYFYGDTDFLAGSVPATEHSVMCAGSKEDERGTYLRLLKTYPTGPLSVVSDTWDFWNVLTVILPSIKDEIMGRDGKLVIRPDSGDPVDIICGFKIIKDMEDVHQGNVNDVVFEIENKYFKIESTNENRIGFKLGVQVENWEVKGAIELLWETFGGTVNEQGYKVLDSHIGLIYGDSITLERCKQICERLEAKGFASTNVVFGIGSFTYQFNTRDTFGFAMKATYIEKKVMVTDCDEVGSRHCIDSCQGDCQRLEEEGFEIFKDPKTDSGLKKSAKGLLKVIQGENGLELVDQISWEELRQDDNLLTVVFKDGKFLKETTMAEIRERVKQIK